MSDKEKKKRGRKAYLSDFTRDVSGQYIYSGELYAFSGDKEARKRAFTRIGLYGFAILALAVLGGCIPSAGMQNCFYVIIPYIIELSAAVSIVWTIIKLFCGGEEIREYIYESTVPRLPRLAVFAVVSTVIDILAVLIFLILEWNGQGIVPTVIALIAKILIILLSFALRRFLAALSFVKTEKKPKSEK